MYVRFPIFPKCVSCKGGGSVLIVVRRLELVTQTDDNHLTISGSQIDALSHPWGVAFSIMGVLLHPSHLVSLVFGQSNRGSGIGNRGSASRVVAMVHPGVIFALAIAAPYRRNFSNAI